MKRIYHAVKRRKKTSAAALIAVAAIAAFTVGPLAKTKAAVRYVTAPVERGTVTQNVTGTGQVEATQLLAMKAKGSATVLDVAVTKGQHVKIGDVLAQLDTRDASKAVRDARVSLESAQVALAKLRKPSDQTALLQAQNALIDSKRKLEDLTAPPDAAALLSAENSVAQATQAVQKAEDDQVSAKDSAYNAIADTHLDLLNTIASLESILNGHDLDPVQGNITVLENSIFGVDRDTLLTLTLAAQNDYYAARNAYDLAFDDYSTTSRYSDLDTVRRLEDETVDAVKKVSESAKSENTLFRFVDDAMVRAARTVPTGVKTQETKLADLTSKTDSRLSSLLSSQSSLKNSFVAIDSANRTLAERTLALQDLKAGATQDDIDAAKRDIAMKEQSLANVDTGVDPLDIRAQEIAVETRQYALQDAEEKLGDYTIVAPFDGVVTDVAAKRGDDVAAGSTVVTVMTEKKLARITMNETDVAKVKEGEKAVLTFDAISDLSVTGEVATVDVVGTVSQGVVSYGVEIGFDVQDERVKPGMTVTASIITALAQDVLTVQNAALKSGANGSTVQVLEAGVPKTVPVTTGVAGETATEIVEGLSEGQEVVTQTIDPNVSKTTATSAAGGFGALGGGGAMRITGGGGR